MTLKSRSKINREYQKTLCHRHGTVVLVPMLCLVLSLTIIGVLLKQTSIEHKQLKKEQYRLQSVWLTDAAAQRATVKLDSQPDYHGEIWRLLPEEIGGNFPGEVSIEIDRNEKNKKLITIRTIADYPIKMAERVRIIREWPIELASTKSNN